jgi:hypothetical protein
LHRNHMANGQPVTTVVYIRLNYSAVYWGGANFYEAVQRNGLTIWQVSPAPGVGVWAATWDELLAVPSGIVTR